MSTNAELAEQLRGIADLLDLMGERFKPEAYRRAARSIETLPEDLRAVAARGQLGEIPGVGAAISEKIEEFLRDGRIAYYERIRAEVPPGVVELMRLSGMGPKTARRFWTDLGVEGPAELSAAIEAGRLTGLSGFGPKKIENLKASLSAAATGRRIPLGEAFALAERLLGRLRSAPVDQLVVAGSLRRRRESVGDLDILATSREPARVLDAFAAMPERTEVKMKGPTKSTILVTGGIQVDLRVVEPAAFGAAWQYFTGSKEHNVELRSLAKDRGLKVNEYGVFRGDERIAGATESDVYGAFGLAWIPPEIREGRGEIASAAAGTLPKLVEEAEILGDLHVHLATFDRAAVDAAVQQGRELHLSYLGLAAPPERVEELRAAVPTPRDVKLYIGAEVAATVDRPSLASADYVILTAAGKAPPTRSAGPTALLLAHLSTGPLGGVSEAGEAGGWLAFARARGAAIELTARGAEDGVDAGQARAHHEAGGWVHLTAGLQAASDRVLSVGLARRAGISADRVLNARPAGPWPTRPPLDRESPR
jgi:DNA polymerase (family 10)